MIGYYRFKNPGNVEVINELVEKLDEINDTLQRQDSFCFYIPVSTNEFVYYSCIEERTGEPGQVDPVFTQEFTEKGIFPEKIETKDFMKATFEVGGHTLGSPKFFRECRE